MKTNKEYPATHSMSTAWYVADEDGNVAIIDYDDNGPVPWETEQTSIDQLVYGHCEDCKTNDFLAIDLTDDQIDDLMENPHQPEEEKWWFVNCVIQIDLSKEVEFLELAHRKDFEIEVCISKERGLYLINAFDSTDEDPQSNYSIIREGSALQKILDKKIILSVFKMKEMYTNSIWEDGNIKFEKEFDNLPYYIYCQPYWPGFLLERMNIPKNPVKLSQFPEALRKRVPVVPIKFKDTKNFQIAEWVPCKFFGVNSVETINGYEYNLAPMTDGSESFVMTDMDASDFYDYCPEKEKYHCKECPNCFCYSYFAPAFTNLPTVMFVVSPLKKVGYDIALNPDIVTQHSIWLSFLQKVPYKPFKREYVSDDEVKKNVTQDMLLDYFLKSYCYLEDMIVRFCPRVIILDGTAWNVLGKRYKFSNHKIEINGTEYPLFSLDEMETYRKEIECLAKLPYRGEKMPHIISKEGMEQYKKKYDVSD